MTTRSSATLALLIACLAIAPAGAQDAETAPDQPIPDPPAADQPADTLPAADQPADTLPAEEPIADTLPADAPAAEEIFERYVEAIGGRDKVFAVTHRKLEGIYRGAPFGGAARITFWQEAPNKSHLKLSEPLGNKFELLYDGQTAWELAQDGTAYELSESRRVEMIETSDIFGEANYLDRYAEMQTIGETVVEKSDGPDEPVWVIEATTPLGRLHTLMFSKETGLFAAEHSVLGGDLESGGTQVLVVLDMYEDIGGGLLFPMRQRQTLIGSPLKVEIVYKRASIEPFEHNFSPPADLQPPPNASGEPDSAGG